MSDCDANGGDPGLDDADRAEILGDAVAPAEPAAPPEDTCACLMRHLPVPGECWVHLRSVVNYLSSLLLAHPPPPPGQPPFMIKGWRSTTEASPFRIQYGTSNPGTRGLVLTSDSVIPNFSFTPRLALEPDATREVLACPVVPDDLLVLPAVHGIVVRLFRHERRWYVASHEQMEPLHDPACPGVALGNLGRLLARSPRDRHRSVVTCGRTCA